MPMDNTVLFNGGYRVLNGYVPFSDYWLVTGPLLDYINAFFFKLLGVSWSTFIIHSSIFNSLIAIASYFFFKKMDLSSLFSLIYALLLSFLFYPVVGTPFVDHHSTFFLILAFFCLMLAVKTNNENYYLFIPTILSLSFLSKQTPAAYGIIIIPFIILFISFFKRKERKEIIKKTLIGTIYGLSFILIFFFITKIKFNFFFDQYIIFASSIGEDRITNYSFNFFNELVKYKFISYFLLVLVFILIKLKLNKKLSLNTLTIIVTCIVLSIILIFHQILSLNQNFIFFLIPFLSGVIHSYYKKVLNKKYFLIITFLICILGVGKYHLRFNEERKFNELENIDISKAVDAKILNEKLAGLKWITYIKPAIPHEELNNLLEVMNIYSQDKAKKLLITEYQIIAPILNIYDNSPNQWHHPSVSFPLRGNKHFKMYKDYFIAHIKKNKIDFIYETREDNKTITRLILNPSCINQNRVGKMLIKIELMKNCEDLQ